MMRKLDLKKSLNKCGASKLTKLIGEDRLLSIVSVMGGRVTENQMVNILISKYGCQIFANKDIRICILHTLDKKSILFLLHGKSSDNAELTEKDLYKLEKSPWKRTNTVTSNWLTLFGLGEEYLPPILQKISSADVIDVDTTLYPYQKRVKDRLIRTLLSKKSRLLLHMPTGAGKTRTTIEGLVDYWRILGETNRFMIWLTDSEELCTQAEESFTKLWKKKGDQKINLSRLWGKYTLANLDINGGLIIASLQKLNGLRKSASNCDFKLIALIRRQSSLVVVDEAHKSIAPTYKATIEFLCDLDKTKLLGLTATPGRTNIDQIDDLVEFYGSNKITLTDENYKDIDNPIHYLQENEYLSQITRKQVPTDITVDLTLKEREAISDFFEIPTRVLLELSKDDQRNTIIIKEVAQLCNDNHQTIVFACSVEHARLISDLLMVRGIQARCVDSTTHSHDRAQYISDYKHGKIKVLVNYGVLTTGFDAPSTSAVVITRPTGSLVLYSQMIGRGIRGPKMGGSPRCVLIDLEDNLKGYPSEKQAFKFFDNYWRNK